MTESNGVHWGDLRIGKSFWSLLPMQLRSIEIPSVPRVDCHQCRRASEGTARWDVRCCDVTPQLPNFLVGEILAKGGHPVIGDWLSQRRADPYFMLVPPDVAQAHIAARQDGQYGLACPFLVAGQGVCSIYHSRPALCVGYHCYYPNTLWQQAWACLTSLLDLYQHAAARQLVATSDIDPTQMAALIEQTNESSLWQGESQDPLVYKALWQHWHGREEAFYLDCFRRLCAAPGDIRKGMASLHRRQLASRLEQQGQLSLPREKSLWEEAEAACDPSAPLCALAPSDEQERLFQRGAIPALANPCTIRESESHLLWYLERLGGSSLLSALWQWIWPDEVIGKNSVGSASTDEVNGNDLKESAEQ